jgi:serine/threonine protein kinase
MVQKGRLSEDEARFYVAEVVDALEYLHGLGLIHRDIKVYIKGDEETFIYICNNLMACLSYFWLIPAREFIAYI